MVKQEHGDGTLRYGRKVNISTALVRLLQMTREETCLIASGTMAPAVAADAAA